LADNLETIVLPEGEQFDGSVRLPLIADSEDPRF